MGFSKSSRNDSQEEYACGVLACRLLYLRAYAQCCFTFGGQLWGKRNSTCSLLLGSGPPKHYALYWPPSVTLWWAGCAGACLLLFVVLVPVVSLPARQDSRRRENGGPDVKAGLAACNDSIKVKAD